MAAHTPAVRPASARAVVDDSCPFLPVALWTDERLGCSKELLRYEFVCMEKPTELDECVIAVTDQQNVDGRPSNFLTPIEAAAATAPGELCVSLRAARTALDCLLSVVLQQMLPGERSRVRIVTSGGETVQLTVELLRIQPNAEQRYLHQLTAEQTLAWATQQKENGVALFKRWPIFAQYAFSRAAQALISLKPFDQASVDVDADQLQQLHDSVCQNLAACLLKQQRYEDVLYVLQEVTDRPAAPERAIYRRATAHFWLRQLDEARTQLERLNYAQHPEQRALHAQIVQQLGEYRNEYSSMVRKMFRNT